MSESDRSALVSVLIPTRKFVQHVVKFSPDWWESMNAAQKGSHPLSVIVKWHVTPEGVRLTVDPWAWQIRHRSGVLRLVSSIPLEEAYEAERQLAGEVAAEEVRMNAVKGFPSYRRWSLLRELSETV